jgi:hypothetical protein
MMHGFEGADDYLTVRCRDLRWWWGMQFFLVKGAWEDGREWADNYLPIQL